MPIHPISLQLYTLREQTKTDFAGVLKRVAAIGYAAVEPAGFGDLGPAGLRKLVEELGMKVSSSHGPWAKPDNLPQVIETAGILGIDLVGSGFGPDQFKDLDAIKATADLVNGMVAPLKKAGLKLFLHNHQWEFERLADGRLKYEVFAGLCPDVQFEIDTYWAANFGAEDPAAWVAKFKARAPLLHIKDGPLVKDQAHVAVGQGKVDVAKVIAAADPKVLRYLVVELDRCDTDMFTAVEQSYRYLTEKKLARGRK